MAGAGTDIGDGGSRGITRPILQLFKLANMLVSSNQACGLTASTGRSLVTYRHILYDVGDKIATITLHRPERMNAWTPIMERDVRHAMETAAADNNVLVIVLPTSGRTLLADAAMDTLNRLH